MKEKIEIFGMPVNKLLYPCKRASFLVKDRREIPQDFRLYQSWEDPVIPAFPSNPKLTFEYDAIKEFLDDEKGNKDN